MSYGSKAKASSGRSSGRRRSSPPTKEYRAWKAAWLGLLLLALCVGLATFFFRQGFSDGALIAAVVAANLMIAAAIVIDATKLRRLREDYQKGLAVASRSKAARAEQKRLRALDAPAARKARKAVRTSPWTRRP